MKRFLLVGALIMIVYSCAPPRIKKQTPKPIITIDTLQKGKPGDKNYSLKVSIKRDSVEIEFHNTFYWDGLSQQDIYKDSMGNNKFIYVDFPDYNRGDRRISYLWLENNHNEILSVDTVYRRGKVIETKYSTPDFLLIKYYKSKRETKVRITDMVLGMEYVKKGSRYIEMDITVLLQYSEWVSSTRSAFGRAHYRFLESFLSAGSKIDNKYVLIAKENYEVDLNKILKDVQQEAVYGSDN